MWEFDCSIEELEAQLASPDLQIRMLTRVTFAGMAKTAEEKSTEEMLVSNNELWRFLGRLKQQDKLKKFNEELNKDSDSLV